VYVKQTAWFVSDVKEDDERLIQLMTTYLNVATDGHKELHDLKQVDLVMFPVLEKSHYYLVCFDLKNPNISVIDNMASSVVSLVDDPEYSRKDTTFKLVSNVVY
jgi:hypothetical protein